MKERPKPESNRTDTVDSGGMSLARITSFSDGVFAVAITLLVLSIHVPLLKPAVADRELPRQLIRLIPIFEAYIISFFVIGLFWIGHHSVFKHFKRHDGGLLWLNLLFLMFVVFIPFPTGLISEYPNSRVALIFYAVSLAIAGIMICLLLWYGVHNDRLIDEGVDPNFYRRFVFGYMDMAGIFLLSVPIAFLNVHVARLFWFLIIPTNLFFDHWFADWYDRRRAAKSENAVA